jgi:hypothetical protein
MLKEQFRGYDMNIDEWRWNAMLIAFFDYYNTYIETVLWLVGSEFSKSKS